MNGITNFLTFLNDNWTLIIACVAAIGGIVAKTVNWFKSNKQDRRKSAIEAVRRSMLALVTEAEQAYGAGTGTVKRSQVLERIFAQHPILAQAVNIEETTNMLDEMIDEALKELRKLLEDNEAFYDIINNTLTITGEELATLTEEECTND